MYKLIPFASLRAADEKVWSLLFKQQTQETRDLVLQLCHQHSFTPSPSLDNDKSLQSMMSSVPNRPWAIQRDKINHMVILQGSRDVEMYCPQSLKREFLTFTLSNVYKHGTLIHNQPCLLQIYPNVYYRLLSGPYGCTSVHIIESLNQTPNIVQPSIPVQTVPMECVV
tara:strand:+ start:523 stop:1026 length:504 start_codon:yes stop_codon:yes gene_type:complete